MNLSSALGELEILCRNFGWTGRDLASGKNYRYLQKTTVSIYTVGTDVPGSIEVAFEVDSIATLYHKTTHEVGAWIKHLQESVCAYAKPKTRYKYPRVALVKNEHVKAFALAVNAFLREDTRNSTSDLSSADPQPSDVSQVDEVVLASILTRRGQPVFRKKLLAAYDGKCALTGCSAEPALEAAHIVPHAEEQSYETSRGILLRADIHTLFDLYLISIEPVSKKIVVSSICEPSYAFLVGKDIASPTNAADYPEPAALMQHFGI